VAGRSAMGLQLKQTNVLERLIFAQRPTPNAQRPT
jgi:hypothetical protein